MDRQDGEFVGHTACPDCGSRDNLTLYIKKDNKGVEYLDGNCWTCDPSYKSPTYLVSQGIDAESYKEYLVNTKRNTKQMTEEDLKFIHEELPTYEIRGNRERRIKKSTYEKYGVHCVVGEDGEPTAYYFPNRKNNEIVGCTVRELPKNFYSIGDAKVTNDLFGQHLFPKGGKFLVITTGREDCMAMYQTLANGDYETPCVSVTNGDGGAVKQIKANYEWVVSFEKVILAFDGDEVGQEAVDKVSKLLKPGQAYAVKFGDYKDASDYMKNGKSGKLKDLFWKAEKVSPTGIVHLSQMWDAFQDNTSRDIIPFPPAFGDLNDMMNGGMERGEITVIGALTSIGKSSIVSNIVYHILSSTEHKVGALYLEGTQREIVRDLLSLDQGTNLRRLKPEQMDMNRLRTAFFEGIAKDDKFIAVDHQGSLHSVDDIMEKLRYLAKAENCDVLIIDPIQASINADSNSAVIDFMDRVLKLAKETNAAVILVSHMRKPASDDPHAVTEYQLMGSSSINQIAFNTILVSRDKMNEDPDIRNSTRIQAVKVRRTGLTGEAGWCRYDDSTTRFYRCDNPYLKDKESGLIQDIESAFSQVDDIPETEDFDEQPTKSGSEIY